MNQPDPLISPLKRLDGTPAFEEQWQAQVLAMADSLIASGTIAPVDWSATLGACLKQAEQAGEPDDLTTYYKAALKALETLLDKGDALATSEVTARRDAWERAYLATPHGQPVILGD